VKTVVLIMVKRSAPSIIILIEKWELSEVDQHGIKKMIPQKLQALFITLNTLEGALLVLHFEKVLLKKKPVAL